MKNSAFQLLFAGICVLTVLMVVFAFFGVFSENHGILAWQRTSGEPVKVNAKTGLGTLVSESSSSFVLSSFQRNESPQMTQGFFAQKPCSELNDFLLQKAIRNGYCGKEFLEQKNGAGSLGSGEAGGSLEANSGDTGSDAASGAGQSNAGARQKLRGKLIEIAEYSLENETPEKVRVLVQANSVNGVSSVSFAARELGADNVRALEQSLLVVAEIESQKLFELAQNNVVQNVWQDDEVKAFFDNGAEQVNAVSVWENGFTGKGVKIAVLDSGIDSGHEMLFGKIVLEKNFSDESVASDGLGHGTHVAGIIAGNPVNGLSGVAPDARLINAKVLDSSGTGFVSSVIEAINWAVDPDNDPLTDDGADIINISFGGAFFEPDSPINRAVQVAVEKGVLVVVAAGNCGETSPSSSCGGFVGVTSPGNSPFALTVGAVDSSNRIAPFSSGELVEGIGVKPDVVAPGVGIESAFLNNSFESLSGTSMATPFVSGVAALLLEANPTLKPIQLHDLIESNAMALGVEGKDKFYGSGLVDANAALNSFVSIPPFTAVSSVRIKTSLNEQVNARVQLYNFSPAKIFVGEVLSDSWISATVNPNPIDANNTGFLNYSIDPAELGVGEFEGKIVLHASNGVSLEHTVFLEVAVENTLQIVDGNVFAAISRPSIIYVNGLRDQGVKVLRNSQVEIKVQAANPLGPARDYAMAVQVFKPNNSLACDLSFQSYFHQANLGKQLFFDYSVPSNAANGTHSVTASSFYSCSGTAYNGSCRSSSAYSCESGIPNNSVTSSNAFTVVDSCSSGVCCDTSVQMPKDATQVCEPNISSEYTCNSGDVYKRNFSKFCSGTGSSCTGESKWLSWFLYDDCSSSETCVQRGSEAFCETGNPVVCTGDADCPSDGYLSGLQCSANNVVKTFRNYFCQNPGTTSSSCQFNDSFETQQTCSGNQVCSGGACVQQACESECSAGEAECDGEFLKTCKQNSLGCFKFEKSACFGSCIDNGSNDSCQENDTSLLVLAEDALTGVNVFKQQRDLLKLYFIAEEPLSVNFSFNTQVFNPKPGSCTGGSMSLPVGTTECVFEVKKDASNGVFSFVARWGNKVKGKNVFVTRPNTVFVTDSEKLLQRFNGDVVGVREILRKAFLRASQNRGIVYDLVDYREEIGVEHPWENFGEYNESVVSPSSKPNVYALAVAGFVKKKCGSDCRHVSIVGDDFVVPSVREFGSGFGDNFPKLSDRAFIPSTLKNLGDVNGFFNKGEGVAFVVPDSMSPELRVAVDDFKKMVKLKYGVLDFLVEEYVAGDERLSCSSYLLHPLAGKTVVLIGTHETNSLFGCFGASAILGGLESFSVYRNSWGDFGPFRKYVLVVNSDSPQTVGIVNYLMEKELIREKNYSQVEFFNDQIQTCDLAGWLPVVDWVSESCAVGLSCFVIGANEPGVVINSDAGFWCSAGGVLVVAAPSVLGKVGKFAAKYGDDFFVAVARVKVGDKYLNEMFGAFISKFGSKGEQIGLKVSRGLGRGVVDGADSELVEKLGRYIDNWNGDPILDETEHQLVKMYAVKPASNVVVQVGQETIENVAVLTKGVPESWGQTHIFEYIRLGQSTTRAKQIQEAFGLENDSVAVLNLIDEGLKNGARNPINPNIIEYSKNDRVFKIVTGEDSDKIGKIITLSFD